ncbi:hypothetical protein AXF42_Ash008587 [Apostasia shenzhenica]|uniref:Uncharacterized protein n=1 Tax=Apostasia shenzhenica TaxID=1088818 RepID=A0A2I0B1T8_9ASPA|nr:hypothetical protein AXF42_Ash008587 [Apostasia shenzhenica]
MASVSTSWAFAPAAVSSSSTAGAVVGTTCSKFLCYFPRRVKSRNSLAASSSDETFTGEAESPDSVKLAFSKAQAYRKAKMKAPLAPVTEEKPSVEFAGDDLGIGGLGPEVPAPVNSSMEKAKEYTENKRLSTEMQSVLGQEDTILWNSTKDFLKNKSNKKDELKISSKDFLGLDFSEKKSYKRVPPGLVPSAGPILGDDVFEVEFIVGDARKFENTPPVLALNDDNTSLYKPKVSTWGVFPRPSNISKTVE